MAASEGFKELDAVVHAITAEDGRDPTVPGKKSNDCGSEIEARLAVRGVTNLGFKVHSDPEHALLLRGSDANVSKVYAIETFEASKYESKTSVPYVDYEMVQPAMTVIKKGGGIQQAWTWKTGELKALFDANPALTYSASEKIPGYGHLVGIRPQTSDIVASIKANRDFALQFQGVGRIVAESTGCSCSIL